MTEHLAGNPDPSLNTLPPRGVQPHPEASPMSAPAAAEFVAGTLAKETVEDVEGLERAAYQIAGQTVLFRNRQETPELEGRAITTLGAEASPPLTLELDTKGTKADASALAAYNEARAPAPAAAGHESVRLVTNTPEGIVAAARQLAGDPAQREYLAGLATKMQAGEYTDPAVLDVVDGMLGAISITDTGEASELYDTDGFALALSALSGNAEAAAIVADKRDALRQMETARRDGLIAKNKQSAAEQREQDFSAEPVPLDTIALVHSTAHGIERDADGNVILTSAAQRRGDKLPRASLHFTLNSQVAPHVLGTYDTWGSSNKLIVANLAKTMDASRQAPESLYGVDTWFDLNPGENLTLPDTVVVEGSSEGALVADTEQGVSFLARAEYDTEQLSEIEALVREYGIADTRVFQSPQDILKEIALRKAMLKAGVPTQLQDTPSSDGHGMANSHLNARIVTTALELGLRTGTHFQTPEQIMEADVMSAMQSAYVEAVSDHDITTGQYASANWVPLAMRRQVLVSGYTPSRPNTLSRESADAGMTVRM